MLPALLLCCAIFLPVVSPAAPELPGSGALAPVPFAAPTESSSVAVPGPIDLAPAAGFS